MGLWAVAVPMVACLPFKEDAPGVTDPWDGGIEEAATDADGPTGPCDLSKPFGVPVLVPGLTAAVRAPIVAGPRLSSDSLTAYFFAGGSVVGNPNYEIYAASRMGPRLPFGPATPLGPAINAPDFDDVSPSVSGDGLTLVFARIRHGIGSVQLPQLYYAIRASASEPYAGSEAVNNFVDGDSNPFLREDGRVLYFARAPMASTGPMAIYRALWTASGFAAPVAVMELNVAFRNASPVVTPDDLTIYFAVGRSFPGPNRVWTATRASTSDPFSPPTPVVELGSFSGGPEFVTRDGCALYLTLSVQDADHPSGTFIPYVAEKPALGAAATPAPDR